MLRNALTASPLLLLLILSWTHGEYVGDGCTIENGGASSTPGTCKVLRDCPVVYEQLLAGILPRKSCGYLGIDPIVCCPTSNQGTNKPTSRPTSTTLRPQVQPGTVQPLNLKERGAVARMKCAESAQAVYGLKIPPTPTFDRKPINVSLCALNSQKLIVGGKKADPKEFPHMVAIGFDSGDGRTLWQCGGTLLSHRIVLTAAHCTWTLDWGEPKWVRVGDLNLDRTDDDAAPETIDIEKIINYPDYRRPAEYHDIAILRLRRDVTYNEWVRPACLPVDWPDVGSDNKAVATGWGLVDWADAKGSDNLLKVTLHLVPQPPCNESYYDDGTNAKLPRGIVNQWQMCAGEEGKDTCQGDSGGPLAVFSRIHNCVYNVVGVTSLGRLCGSNVPGVYTRVYYYIPWIEKVAWPEHF